MTRDICAFGMTSSTHRADRCTRPGVCRVRFKHRGDTAWRTDYRRLCRAHAVQYRQILVNAGLAPEDVEVQDA